MAIVLSSATILTRHAMNAASKVSDIPRRYKAVWKDDRKARKVREEATGRKHGNMIVIVGGAK